MIDVYGTQVGKNPFFFLTQPGGFFGFFLGFFGFYWVLLGFIGFYWVFLGFLNLVSVT